MAGFDWSPYAVGGATRPDSFTGMDPRFSSALQQMFMAAPDDIRQSLRVGSGFRSVGRQQELWNGALKKYGSPEAARKWVAPPGRSQHGKGNASDLKYLSPAAKQWAHANAAQFGLAFPLSNENWHIELAGARGGKQPAAQTLKGGFDPIAEVSAAAGRPVGASAAMMSPTPLANNPGAPGAFQPTFGDVVAPQAVQTVPVNDFGTIIAAHLAKQKANAETQQAEQLRRNALLGDLGKVFG